MLRYDNQSIYNNISTDFFFLMRNPIMGSMVQLLNVVTF